MPDHDSDLQDEAGPADVTVDANDDAPDAAATREKVNQALIQFWRQQLRDVHVLDQPLVEFKNHPLPLARIKKIMKSDEDVRMISSEAPVLFAKACELFILELTHRAWAYSEANKRRTLQHNDLVHAICNHENDVFEFLTDNIPPAAVQAANDGTAHIPPAMYASMAAATAGAQQVQAGSMMIGQPPAATTPPDGVAPATSAMPGPQVPTGSMPPQVSMAAPPGAQAQHPVPPPQQQQYVQYMTWPGMQPIAGQPMPGQQMPTQPMPGQPMPGQPMPGQQMMFPMGAQLGPDGMMTSAVPGGGMHMMHVPAQPGDPKMQAHMMQQAQMVQQQMVAAQQQQQPQQQPPQQMGGTSQAIPHPGWSQDGSSPGF